MESEMCHACVFPNEGYEHTRHCESPSVPVSETDNDYYE